MKAVLKKLGDTKPLFRNLFLAILFMAVFVATLVLLINSPA